MPFKRQRAAHQRDTSDKQAVGDAIAALLADAAVTIAPPRGKRGAV
jgi:hypothetical protein